MLILTTGKCLKALRLHNYLSYSLAGAPSTVLRFKVGPDLDLLPPMTISSGKSSVPEKLCPKGSGASQRKKEVVPLFSDLQNTNLFVGGCTLAGYELTLKWFREDRFRSPDLHSSHPAL
jgi:hypothetical protein